MHDNYYIDSPAGNKLIAHYKNELVKAIKNKDINRKKVVISVLLSLKPDILQKNKRE